MATQNPTQVDPAAEVSMNAMNSEAPPAPVVPATTAPVIPPPFNIHAPMPRVPTGLIAGQHERRGAKLTLRGMQQVLAEGGSVSYKGHILTHASHLPSESELAQGNREEEAAALAGIEARQKQLDAERARLNKSVVSTPLTATPVKPAK